QTHQRNESALQEGKTDAEERDEGEPEECNEGRQQIVERIGRIDACECGEQTCGGERRRYLVAADRGDGALQRPFAQPLAANRQSDTEQEAEGAACSGS